MTRALLTLALLVLALLCAVSAHTAGLVAGRGAGDWGVEWQQTAVASELESMGGD